MQIQRMDQATCLSFITNKSLSQEILLVENLNIKVQINLSKVTKLTCK